MHASIPPSFPPGKSPAFVSASCAEPAYPGGLRAVARRVAWGKLFNAGQTCLAIDHVLVEASIHDAFVAEVTAAVAALHPAPHGAASGAASGHPRPFPDLARVVNAATAERLRAMVRSHAAAGGAVGPPGALERAAAAPRPDSGHADDDARLVAPAVLSGAPTLDGPSMKSEIFGPVLPVVGVGSAAHAARLINDRHPDPLALYAFGRDVAALRRDLLDRVPSGGACLNDCFSHYASPDLPFGGSGGGGGSGLGASHGRAGFDAFTHRRGVLERGAWGLEVPDGTIRYPPYATGIGETARIALVKFLTSTSLELP